MSDHAHGTTTIEHSGLKQPYHLVDPSPWPIIVFITMFFWWRDVVRESRTPGMHTPVVRLGLRYGMLFFISSEVMFFVGFFWAFFNFALFPDLQGNGQTVWT